MCSSDLGFVSRSHWLFSAAANPLIDSDYEPLFGITTAVRGGGERRRASRPLQRHVRRLVDTVRDAVWGHAHARPCASTHPR